MYKAIFTLLILSTVGSIFKTDAQVPATSGQSAPKSAIKSNFLYNVTATLNLGVELSIGRKITLELPLNYNPWTFSDDKKWRHILIQPELRWWMCERYNGGFWGVHTHYAFYNAGNLSPLNSGGEMYRYQGWLAGAGISYGYNWILSPRWGLEATIGAGYALLKYDRYYCGECGDFIDHNTRHYFGPTKAGITLIYLIK